MPTTAYVPSDFWRVIIARKGSALTKVLPRSFGVALVGCFPAVCVHYKDKLLDGIGFEMFDVPNQLVLPFGILVGLLLSFRMQNAFEKWQKANMCLLHMHAGTRKMITHLVTTFPSDEDRPRIEECRRLVLLWCVSVSKKTRGVKDYNDLLELGLLKPEEARLFKMTATVSGRKEDKFPTRNRPALVFQWLEREIQALFVKHKLQSTPIRAVASTITHELGDIAEEVEYLEETILPLAYAQLTRLCVIAFLLLILFSATVVVKWFILPLSFVGNVIYFTVDYCASEMEAPFGDDMMDVDLDKALRRLDKHTAAQLAAAYPLVDGELTPVVNYDLYPETASTDNAHAETSRGAAQHNIYHLEAAHNSSQPSLRRPSICHTRALVAAEIEAAIALQAQWRGQLVRQKLGLRRPDFARLSSLKTVGRSTSLLKTVGPEEATSPPGLTTSTGKESDWPHHV